MFKGRSVIEIMVLVFTFIVAFTLVGLGIIILVVEIKHPEADTALLVNTMMSLVSGILGALLGLIAGKSNNQGGSNPCESDLDKRPDGSPSDLTEP
jgi:uncharacterized membrane protein HdeD (DUF308 family)